jgi:hypothetical protein
VARPHEQCDAERPRAGKDGHADARRESRIGEGRVEGSGHIGRRGAGIETDLQQAHVEVGNAEGGEKRLEQG